MSENPDASTEALLGEIDRLNREVSELRGPEMITIEEQRRRWAEEILGAPSGGGG